MQAITTRLLADVIVVISCKECHINSSNLIWFDNIAREIVFCTVNASTLINSSMSCPYFALWRDLDHASYALLQSKSRGNGVLAKIYQGHQLDKVRNPPTDGCAWRGIQEDWADSAGTTSVDFLTWEHQRMRKRGRPMTSWMEGGDGWTWTWKWWLFRPETLAFGPRLKATLFGMPI